MAMDALPEAASTLSVPVYGPYVYARSLLAPGDQVLDVGCGNAKVSAYLAESGALVDGVEPSANRASAAALRVRYLSTDPIGHDDPRLLDKYDVITFFDVIEHIADPAQVLEWCVGRLANGGRIVVSIPNSAHVSFRTKMLRGDWSMTDSGLFDRTHLRFYDPTTARALRPAGTVETDRRFYMPGPESWRLRLMSRVPTLFSLHVLFVWQLDPVAV